MPSDKFQCILEAVSAGTIVNVIDGDTRDEFAVTVFSHVLNDCLEQLPVRAHGTAGECVERASGAMQEVKKSLTNAGVDVSDEKGEAPDMLLRIYESEFNACRAGRTK